MKILWAKFLCVWMVIGLAVCGYAKESLVSVSIQLNWIPNVEFAGILIAKDKGWYEEAGIDLILKKKEKGISVVDEVISGRAMIGITGGSDLIKSVDKGLKIKAVAAQFQKSPFCLMSKNSQGIEKPEQLKGKKIGIKGPEGELMVKVILANYGINIEEVTIIPTGWELDPFIENKLDVLQAYMNNEPLILKEKGYDVTYLPAFKHGYDFYTGVFFTTENVIQEHPKLIQNFLDVTWRGWKEAFKDPGATAKIIVEKFYPEGSVIQQTESLKIFKHLATIGLGEHLIGYMEEQFWQKGIDILYQFKQIDKKIPASQVFTLEFLKK